MELYKLMWEMDLVSEQSLRELTKLNDITPEQFEEITNIKY